MIYSKSWFGAVFRQRRKQLGKLLRQELSHWNDAAKTLGLNPAARGEIYRCNNGSDSQTL